MVELGHVVYSDHILGKNQSDLEAMSVEDNIAYHKKILTNIRNSDLVIVECSYQSFSVGYLASVASQLGKVLVMVYQISFPKPNLFPSLDFDAHVEVHSYSSNTELKEILECVSNIYSMDKAIRFNFFLSNELNAYLNWLSKNTHQPKSAIVRSLLEHDMSSDPDYNAN